MRLKKHKDIQKIANNLFFSNCLNQKRNFFLENLEGKQSGTEKFGIKNGLTILRDHQKNSITKNLLFPYSHLLN